MLMWTLSGKAAKRTLSIITCNFYSEVIIRSATRFWDDFTYSCPNLFPVWRNFCSEKLLSALNPRFIPLLTFNNASFSKFSVLSQRCFLSRGIITFTWSHYNGTYTCNFSFDGAFLMRRGFKSTGEILVVVKFVSFEDFFHKQTLKMLLKGSWGTENIKRTLSISDFVK